MNPDQEKKILTSLVKKLEADTVSIVHRPWFSVVLWLFIVAAIFLLLQLGRNGLEDIYLIISSSMIGIVVGFFILKKTGRYTWAALKSHLDKDSIEKRIKELST